MPSAASALSTATTTIEIQRDSYKITGVQGVEPETTPTDMEFYQTQYGLLRATSLAQRVATELRLYDDANFFQMFGNAAAQEWCENGRVRSNAPPREFRIRKAAEILGIDPDDAFVAIAHATPRPAMGGGAVGTGRRSFDRAGRGRYVVRTIARRAPAESQKAAMRPLAVSVTGAPCISARVSCHVVTLPTRALPIYRSPPVPCISYGAA